MARKRLEPPENFAEMARQFVKDAAKSCEVSDETVWLWLKTIVSPDRLNVTSMPAEVPALKADGWTAKEIAERFGTYPAMVYRWFDRNGIPRRKNRPRGSEPLPKKSYKVKRARNPTRYCAKYAAIIADRMSGKSLREVGALHGITGERVRQIMVTAGIDYRIGLSKEKEDKLRELVTRDPPLTWKVIEKEMCMDYARITENLNRMGLKKPLVAIQYTRKCDYDQVRADYATGKFTYSQLGQKHGIGTMTAHRIVNYETQILKDRERQRANRTAKNRLPPMPKSDIIPA